MSMGIQEILFLIVIFISYTFEAMTGFAGTLLAMPSSMMLIGVYEAKAALNIVALVTCTTITILHYKSIDWREFIKIILLMLIGMVIGIILFERLPSEALLTVYGVFILAIALKNLVMRKELKPLPLLGGILIVLLAGVIHGMFISGGALLVLYAMTVLREKAVFRATVAAIWLVLNAILLINQIRMGYVTSEVMTLTMYAAIPLFFAIIIGNYLHRYIKQETFTTITYILLLLSGIILLFF